MNDTYEDNFRYVYVDYHEDDGRAFYVGIGNIHRTKNLKRNVVHSHIVNKHGIKRNVVKCFPVSIGPDGKLVDEDVVQLALTERYLIRKLQTHVSQGGANFTDGGDMVPGGKLSAETRAKMSEARRNRLPASAETRAKLSEAARNPSAETRAKISEAARNPSPETRAKLSEAGRGRKHTAETRAKMSEANRIRARANRLMDQRPELSYDEAKAIVIAENTPTTA